MDDRYGFIGLGNMGEGMATNLARKRFPLTVRDVRADVVARLESEGATSVGSNREVGAASHVVFVAVFDDQQVLDVCLGNADDPGVIAALPAGGVVVIHSTVSPSTLRHLSDRGAERGVTVMDAAMTGGGDVAARAGALTFFVGGDSETLERIRAALDAMAKNVFHVGKVGSGVVAKIISNFLGISNVALVREATRLARSMEIDEGTILAMIEAGGVGSSWVSNNWQRIRAQEQSYTTGKSGFVAMASKDLHLANELASESGTEMRVLGFIVENVVPALEVTGLTG
jgi:3-hydroxyisobutyrate dehydrogenase-like beta-hydroxyacid dehydrogenase